MQPVVERVTRERAVGADHHDRHIQRLDALADALRQRCGRAVKAVACLGIEQHRRFERPHAVEHVAHERRVRTELARGDAADAAHQPLLADKAVRRADDVERARVQHRLRDFEVEKARVVHQDKAGLIAFDLRHADLLAVEMRRQKVGRGGCAQDRPEQERRLFRLFVHLRRLGKRLFICHIDDFNFHSVSPARRGCSDDRRTSPRCALQRCCAGARTS